MRIEKAKHVYDSCPECGGNDGEEPHDPQCMTGRLESIELVSEKLRGTIAKGSVPPFTTYAELLIRRMRVAVIELETTLAADAREDARQQRAAERVEVEADRKERLMARHEPVADGVASHFGQVYDIGNGIPGRNE